MFLSTYNNRVDAKGRVSVPAKYRNMLIDNVVIVWPSFNYPSLDACSADFLKIVMEHINSFPVFSKEREQLSCAIMANMHELSIDQNGRIIIPDVLCNYAEINESVTFIGQGDKFQIWNPANANDFINLSLAKSRDFNFFNMKDKK